MSLVCRVITMLIHLLLIWKTFERKRMILTLTLNPLVVELKYKVEYMCLMYTKLGLKFAAMTSNIFN